MSIRQKTIIAAAALGLAFPAAAAFPAFAQSDNAPAQTQTQSQTQPAQQDFSDDTLKSFAVAFLEVDQINRTYAPQMEEAATPEAQQQIQEQASQEMVGAVENAEGISVQEYTSIMQAAQADPELAQQLTTYIGEASQGPAPAE